MKNPKRIATDRLGRWAYLIAIVGFPLLILSTAVAVYQLSVAVKIASSQNNIALSTMFFHWEDNIGIIDAIETEQKILKAHGGKYGEAQLDIYLGDFETIDQAYIDGLLSDEQFCSSFAYYVTITVENDEIQKYIQERQKNDSKYFVGLDHLKKVNANTSNKICH